MFDVLIILAILIAFPFLGWLIWFVIEFIRYIASGEYEVDKRLWKITR